MLPAPKKQQKPSHKLKAENIEVLKMAALYGANASGKSNLIKTVSLLQSLITEEGDYERHQLSGKKFRKNRDSPEKPILIAIEFAIEQKLFTYAIKFGITQIWNEELYRTGDKESLIFERETNESGKTKTRFPSSFEEDHEGKILKSIIEKNLTKPTRPLFKQLSELDNPYFEDLKLAFTWFTEHLTVITPEHSPVYLPYLFDRDAELRKYANYVIRSIGAGIKELDLANVPADPEFLEHLGID
ncbi:MAG: AAA family ATPase, partial [Bacteroidota bacterium]